MHFLARLPCAAYLFIVFAISPAAVLAEGETTEDIVRLHMSTLRRIRRFDVSVDTFDYRSRSQSSGKTVLVSWRWSRSIEDGKERIKFHYPEYAKKGCMNAIGDIFKEKETTRYLSDWDPQEPKFLSLGDQQGIAAVVSHRDPLTPLGFEPSVHLSMKFVLAPFEVTRSLEELVDYCLVIEGPDHVELDGRSLVILKLFPPGNDGEPSKSYYEVYLDPTVGWLARRTVMYLYRDELGEGAGITREVTKYRNLGNGVYFPEEWEMPAPEDRVGVSRVTDLVVNGQMPDDAFDFRFPENAIVRHLNEKEIRVSLWGPDNKPLRDVGREEISNARTIAQLNDSSNLNTVLFVTGTSLFLLLATIWWIRYNTRKG